MRTSCASISTRRSASGGHNGVASRHVWDAARPRNTGNRHTIARSKTSTDGWSRQTACGPNVVLAARTPRSIAETMATCTSGRRAECTSNGLLA